MSHTWLHIADGIKFDNLDDFRFMQSVQEGEQLLMQGPDFFIVAAAAFFKALKVYPNPLELLKIYQKAVPEQALSYVYEMVARDVRDLVRRVRNVLHES